MSSDDDACMFVSQEDLSRCVDPIDSAAAAEGSDSNSNLVQGALSNSNLVLVDVSRKWKCGEAPQNQIFANPK
jgi:hypothetical protein